MLHSPPIQTKTDPENKTLWPWMLVAAGLLALNLLFFHPIDLVPFRVLLFILAFFTIQFATIFLHELAHLFAAILFRMAPATLVIGAGPKLAEFNLGKIVFRFCSSTNEGCVIPTYSNRNINKFVLTALYAAGPLADFILLVILAKLLFFPHGALSEYSLFESQVKPLLYISVAYTFYFQIAYLLQRESYTEGRYTDARGIADALDYVPAPQPVHEAFQRIEQRFFQSETYPADPVPSDAQDMQTYVKWALSLPKTTPEHARYFQDLFITTTILYGWSANLPLADKYSRELLASDPSVITFQGSRGSVLVDLGELQAGKSLLEEVFTKSKSDVDRVISAAFIGITEHRLGNPAAAQEWLARATTIDPSSLAVKRARDVLALTEASPKGSFQITSNKDL